MVKKPTSFKRILAGGILAITVISVLPSIKTNVIVTVRAEEVSVIKEKDIEGIHCVLDSNGLLTMTGTQKQTQRFGNSWSGTSILASEFADATSIIADFIPINDTSYLFAGMSNIKEVTLTDNFCNNTVNVISMCYMFTYCTKLERINGLEKFDTSNVVNISNMFAYSSKLKSLNLSTWNLSKVTDMRIFTKGCSSLAELILPDTFDMNNIGENIPSFQDNSSLKLLDLSMMDFSNVTSLSSGMFKNSAVAIKLPKNIRADVKFDSDVMENDSAYYIVDENMQVTPTIFKAADLKSITKSVTITRDKTYVPSDFISGGSSTGDNKQETTVNANVKQSFTVKIPAVINLSNTEGTFECRGNYVVSAKGILSENAKVHITPVSEFIMTGTDENNTAEATVRQDKTEFSELTADVWSDSKGNISVIFKSADSYSGKLKFTFGLIAE